MAKLDDRHHYEITALNQNGQAVGYYCRNESTAAIAYMVGRYQHDVTFKVNCVTRQTCRSCSPEIISGRPAYSRK